jgi:threonine synthase
MTDLSVNPFSGKNSVEDPLSAEQILYLTNNSYGYDLTSAGGANEAAQVQAVFYDDLAKDVFKEKPDEVYMPFGGGVLYADLMIRQYLITTNNYKEIEAMFGLPERQLTKEDKDFIETIKKTSLLGAEPEDLHSIADKLTAPVKPFIPFTPKKLETAKKYKNTSKQSGIYKVSESEIKEAYQLMKRFGEPLGMKTEPSAAAGLALYAKRKRDGLVKKDAKVIIINSGSGILLDQKS